LSTEVIPLLTRTRTRAVVDRSRTRTRAVSREWAAGFSVLAHVLPGDWRAHRLSYAQHDLAAAARRQRTPWATTATPWPARMARVLPCACRWRWSLLPQQVEFYNVAQSQPCSPVHVSCVHSLCVEAFSTSLLSHIWVRLPIGSSPLRSPPLAARRLADLYVQSQT